MAKLIKTDGTESDFPLPDQKDRLAALQGAVGGYIEILPTRDQKLMVLNEEGKIKGLPLNEKATEIMRGVIADSDFIVGDVLICEKNEID